MDSVRPKTLVLLIVAAIGQRLTATGGFGTLDIELLQFPLQPKRPRLGLEGLLQRRGLRRQLPPQLDGDLGEPRVGFGGGADELLSFVLAYGIRSRGRELPPP